MKYLILVLSLILFAGCEDKKKSNVETNSINEDSISDNVDLSSEDDVNYWVAEIDAEVADSPVVSYSFQFSNDTEELYVLVYHINGLPVRIDEKFSNYVYKTYGTRSYYLQNDLLVFSKEVKDEVLADSTHQIRETVSYYTNSKVKNSGTRVAPYEEELVYEEFKSIDPITHPFDDALEILNNTGKYEILFSDIIEASNSTFLVLSTNTENSMRTAVMLEYRDEFANQLLANKKKFKGKKVEILFEMVTTDGMTYQAYRGGKFID